MAAWVGYAGSAAAGGASLLDAGVGWANYILNRRAYEANKEMAWLQMWREDHAMQLRVADLKRAGLSPALAMGGTSAGNVGTYPIQFKAPQMPEGTAASSVLAVLEATQKISEISRTNAERLAIEQRMRNEATLLPHKILSMKSGSINALERAATENYDRRQSQFSGQTTNPGMIGGAIRSIFGFVREAVDSARRETGTNRLPGNHGDNQRNNTRGWLDFIRDVIRSRTR